VQQKFLSKSLRILHLDFHVFRNKFFTTNYVHTRLFFLYNFFIIYFYINISLRRYCTFSI